MNASYYIVEVLPAEYRLEGVPANFGKGYPGTREYLRPFWAGTRALNTGTRAPNTGRV